jgi:predicted transcriptional regulator
VAGGVEVRGAISDWSILEAVLDFGPLTRDEIVKRCELTGTSLFYKSLHRLRSKEMVEVVGFGPQGYNGQRAYLYGPGRRLTAWRDK